MVNEVKSTNLDDAKPKKLIYEKPKILLIDMLEEAGGVLRAEGFNIVNGSFGRAYEVENPNPFIPVETNGYLPRFLLDQDIIVIDLEFKDYGKKRKAPYTTKREVDFWVRSDNGEIDPRPLYMWSYRDKLDTIISHGGVCIVFADADFLDQKILWAHHSQINALAEGMYAEVEDINVDDWSFLPIFDSGLEVNSARGEEIILSSNDSLVLPASYLRGAFFECTFQPSSHIEKQWITIATDKYERPVSGAILPKADDGKGGVIFIFPQLKDKAAFLNYFVKQYLTSILPHLFPEFEGSKWVRRTVYELPRIQDYYKEIELVEEQAREKTEILRKKIESEREEKSFLYELIQTSGDSLVDAVGKALQLLGFQSIVDVDAELAKNESDSTRDEDLQIHDRSPILLIEIKGITGFPSDEDALAVLKYLPTRMREWNRTDVRGLSIINHQRNLPGLEREKNPFREKIVENANAHQFGLLTGWNLFRLARGYLRNGWNRESIIPLFYKDGVIEPVPTHYEYIGIITRFLDKIGVVGVKIECGSLHITDRIAFELPLDFIEQDVESLHVDDQPAEVGEVGNTVGIKTNLTKREAKENIRVFRIISQQN